MKAILPWSPIPVTLPTARAVKLAGGACVDYTLQEANNWEPDFEELEKLSAKPKPEAVV